MTCIKCGKEITGEGIAFCPYCGAKLETAEKKPVSKEAEEWVQKALKVTSLPERKKILEQAKTACPDSTEIDWELLFIGTPDPKPNPEEKMREYLGRLCREYIEIFLKEDNQLMGNIFGLRIGRNRDKVLEEAVNNMIRLIEADEQLSAERKQMLKEAMAQALKG